MGIVTQFVWRFPGVEGMGKRISQYIDTLWTEGPQQLREIMF